MYKQIQGPETTNENIRYATISVLPKSSYLGVIFFFQVYSRLLNNPYEKIEYSAIPMFYELSSTYGKEYLDIVHTQCPKFNDIARNNQHQLWQALNYDLNIPWNMQLRDSLGEEYSAQHRIVFIYRNPLDQLLSHYRYLKGIETHSSKVNVELNDFTDFIFKRDALSSYIKMFYSYHIMRQYYPEHILFVPYEELVTNKSQSMKRIINHLGLPLDALALNRAVEQTRIEDFKNMENYGMDAELQQNFVSNVRNGGIGVWRDYMTPDLVMRIETELQKFGLSLSMFNVGDNLGPEYQFLNFQPHILSTCSI